MCESYVSDAQLVELSYCGDRCPDLMETRVNTEEEGYPSAPIIDAIFPFIKASRMSLGDSAYESYRQWVIVTCTSLGYSSINRLVMSICSSVSRTAA